LKALKIERLLRLDQLEPGFRMLEIGCGSGGISHYFATHPQIRCSVDAVDLVDNRGVRDGFRFHQVDGTRLPFPDQHFDVVITNHVIEHVGTVTEQRTHLAELFRVMRQCGVGYLAVPNRWQLVEPHYRLAFLSWLPRRLRSPYLRLMRKGGHYDCEPLEMGQLERLLSEAGFRFENLCVPALHHTLAIEGVGSLQARIASWLPDRDLALLHPIFPTLIYRLHRHAAGPGAGA
jgi:ubiquinone/menaquinone biosynthesis C-methylase UbiE